MEQVQIYQYLTFGNTLLVQIVLPRELEGDPSICRFQPRRLKWPLPCYGLLWHWKVPPHDRQLTVLSIPLEELLIVHPHLDAHTLVRESVVMYSMRKKGHTSSRSFLASKAFLLTSVMLV